MEGIAPGFKDLAIWLRKENNRIVEGEWRPKNCF